MWYLQWLRETLASNCAITKPWIKAILAGFTLLSLILSPDHFLQRNETASPPLPQHNINTHTQAALLHDTVEDTDTHPEDLDVFGEEVRGLVMEVSDDKSLPKMERKRLQV